MAEGIKAEDRRDRSPGDDQYLVARCVSGVAAKPCLSVVPTVGFSLVSCTGSLLQDSLCCLQTPRLLPSRRVAFSTSASTQLPAVSFLRPPGRGRARGPSPGSWDRGIRGRGGLALVPHAQILKVPRNLGSTPTPVFVAGFLTFLGCHRDRVCAVWFLDLARLVQSVRFLRGWAGRDQVDACC